LKFNVLAPFSLQKLLEIKKTSDGSATLYNSELNEHYHSTFGAYTESMHIFINNGLLVLNKKNIKILEIGFGTGLNAILSYETALNNNLKIDYTGIELYPLPFQLIKQLSYESFINTINLELFYEMHNAEWNKTNQITSEFNLKKIQGDFNELPLNQYYDLAYFDAFGPDVQPEMWSLKNFIKIYNALNDKGILVTYSSKGDVKRNLRDAGFVVSRLQGPPGKRHMIRAEKQIDKF
jgi:tRNA U34 5-methylaminomethyl-2-thiouridine-forming methyltransferase MnmC